MESKHIPIIAAASFTSSSTSNLPEESLQPITTPRKPQPAGPPKESIPNGLSTGPPKGPPRSGAAYSAFSPARRRLTLTIVTIAGFFGPLAAGVYLPALPILQNDFGTSATTINATVSVFMAVLAVAPLFWASRADYAGRRPLYLISLLIYMAANILLAALPANLPALFILRIVQGFGAASVLSLGSGTVADLIPPKGRASAMSVVLLGPQLGPVLGPLLGGAIAGSASWRWIFGFLALTCATLYLVLLFCLPETLRSIVGKGHVYKDKPLILVPLFKQPTVVNGDVFPRAPPPTLLGLIKLVRYPPIVVVSINGALLFASYYAINVTISRYLKDQYGFSTTEVGVAYLAPGLSLISGSLISGRISDLHRAYYTKSNPKNPPHPEHRLHLQIPGVLVSLSGVLMYGWFVHFHLHVSSIIIASSIAAFGMTWVFITTTSYLTESFRERPATLVALASLFRNPAAAVAAAVIEPLVRRMGVGWCFTGLALMELLCVAGLICLIYWGKSMRERLERREAKGEGAEEEKGPASG
ncbi:MFS general substrate transporter [Delitschia confertaspora ATCC 74209]|uniref:MFS general substrate transporter n=1 Tax=Delitschia confertaspora ATCC 74209 TaxID=1513339 RepID=A0A9P4JN29_9PLEO|nr:MFS general substrate transporter [Delitschia confertaspora ATCC 74209]